MSLGSRIATRGRAAVNASLIPTPREPLTFLYPSWVRNSSSAAPEASNGPTSHPRAKPRRSTPLNASDGFQSKKSRTGASAVQAKTKSANPTTQDNLDSPAGGNTLHHGSSADVTTAGDVKSQPKQTAASAQVVEDSNKDWARKRPRQVPSSTTTTTTIETGKELYPDTFQYHPISASLPSQAPGYEALRGDLKFQDDVKVEEESSAMLQDIESRVRKIVRAVQYTQRAKESASEVREDFQEYRRVATDNWTPDWRTIIEDLRKNTIQSEEWYEQQIQIVVPPDKTQLLLTGLDTFIWDIGQNYGCSIKLGRGGAFTGSPWAFILSGSKAAISKTLADVLLIAPAAKITRTVESAQLPLPAPATPGTSDLAVTEPLLSLEPQSPPKLRRVVAFARPTEIYQNPDDVPRPSTWTQQSFFDYVKALTSSSTIDKHYHAIADALSLLFRDPEPALKAVITRAACHEALQYLAAANRMVDVRVLFVRMELLRLPLSTETFNIMLRGVAKAKDLHNFHFILHLMLKRGLMANGYTWRAFMMALDNFEIKLHVAMAMKQKGLLQHTSMVKAVCEQMIQAEVELSLDAHQTQEAFVAHMDARYGRQWLSLVGGNLVLDVLGSRGLIARCWDFLHFMDSRFIRPNHYSINTILNHCKQTVNMLGAIKLMESIPKSWTFRPNEETFRILFDLAWMNRHFNLAKVIWKYSCMADSTPRRGPRSPKECVKHSLRAAWHVPHSPGYRWNYYAGSVIFGAHCGLHPMRLLLRHTHRRLNLEATQRLLPGLVDSTSMIPRSSLGFGPIPPNPEPVYARHAHDLPLDSIAIQQKEKYFTKMPEEFKYDLDLSKHMAVAGVTPKLSFTEMLGAAWKEDQEWRKDGTYRHARLRQLMAKAIKIPLVLKNKGSEEAPDVLL